MLLSEITKYCPLSETELHGFCEINFLKFLVHDGSNAENIDILKYTWTQDGKKKNILGKRPILAR